jgi:hypothetical protein|tara:strand:- start:90 stop:362 length:273 start_codon:yes stop_codon:yes gene_type:complete
VIFISFHDDVLTEILISVHSGGEEHVIADNTFLSRFLASGGLDESSSAWESLSPGWLIEEWWGIVKSDGRSSTKKAGNSEFHVKFIYFLL